MGLFDRFSKSGRGKNAGKQQEDSISDYSGMRVEVMNEEQELMNIARLNVSLGGKVELQRVDDAEADAPEAAEADPEAEATVHVLLRGFDRIQQKAIHMEGDANPEEPGLWRMERIKIISKANDRAFYRQDVDIPGELRPLGRGSTQPMEPCRLVNISAGGVCIQSETDFEVGERLFLRSRLMPNYEVVLQCIVRRVTPRRGSLKEYGCKFENMDANSEDQIAKAIFQIQANHRKL